MHLKSLRLENFKCFKKAEIDFSRVTLLTGANSSGKSSLIYGVLGALQSENFPYQFSTNGRYINMGDFRNISYKYNKNGQTGISLKFDNISGFEIKTTWIEDKVNKLPFLKNLEFKTNSALLNINYEDKYLLNFSYNNPSQQVERHIDIPAMNLIVDNTSKQDKEISSLIKDLLKQGEKTKIQNEINFNSIDELKEEVIKLKSIYLVSTYLKVEKELKKFIQQLNYISSFRLHPERTYLEQSKSKYIVDSSGLGYLDQIIYWQTKKMPEYKNLVRQLKSIGIVEAIKSNRLDGGRFEILVKPQKSGAFSSLADVGFGISQFIPIIVADLQLDDDSTLFVSQPEIHLHPSIQSKFGEYLTSQVKTTNKNYVVETHSEYLINRLRLAVVEGDISEEDVKLYHIENKNNEAIVHRVQLTKTGEIKGAPQDFFDTYMVDTMNIAMAAMTD